MHFNDAHKFYNANWHLQIIIIMHKKYSGTVKYMSSESAYLQMTPHRKYANM